MSLPVEWGLTKQYQHHGKFKSLSAGGCLLETAAIQPLYGKTIYIRVPLPDRDWWEIQGEVLYYVRDVGFGVQFSEMTDDDKGTLRLLMQHHREHTDG
jgi:hypothetical protein